LDSLAHRIVSKFGEAGMGAVYRATDTKLNREVITVASAKTRVLSKDALYVQDWSPDGRSILCTDVMVRWVLLVPIDQPEEGILGFD
jgi:hypothetical protein